MSIEQQLKAVILDRYKSIRAFSEKIDIPYSTIDSIFKRGIQNSSVANIIKICNELGIDTDELAEGHITPRANKNILAAAAHFDIDKLTNEGRERYEEYIAYLAEKFSKEKKE